LVASRIAQRHDLCNDRAAGGMDAVDSPVVFDNVPK
jgi:hypothetical protein